LAAIQGRFCECFTAPGSGQTNCSNGRKISQATVAEALGIGQMQISRLEKRKDPRLSTMARTVAAMGGHLTLIATFADREPVVLVT
jgi:transcriptional regulator with XRE-family HTH domain